jgi:small conductance mechanosensitive channel
MPQQDDSTEIQQTIEQAQYDFSAAVERVDSWIDGGIRLIPNLIVALLVIAFFYGLGFLARKIIRRRTSRKQRDNLGEVLGGFVRWMIIILGYLLGATIVIPSLRPGDLIAGLGISSVAIGFAFKDILQNWLAGLLILLRQPFENNDQIKVNDFEGTVERIETRATIIRTYDGERILIPNSEIYTNALLVKTAHDKRRSQYDVGIGYGDGIENACEVILNAVKSVAEVERDPAPDVLPWDLAASWVAIRVRWWTHSRRADVVQVHAKVILAVKNALDEAGIDMPFETQVHLFHDQTEEQEGDRTQQREGWPAPKKGSTMPRWKAKEEERKKYLAGDKERKSNS